MFVRKRTDINIRISTAVARCRIDDGGGGTAAFSCRRIDDGSGGTAAAARWRIDDGSGGTAAACACLRNDATSSRCKSQQVTTHAERL